MVEQPSIKDLLNNGDTYQGIANYIATEETPLTISVEGDWGTGKTTAMHHIECMIKDQYKDVVTVWFNPWQLSQFEKTTEELSVELIKKLTCDIAAQVGNANTSAQCQEIIDRLRRIGKGLFKGVVNFVADKAGAEEIVKPAIDEFFDSEKSDSIEGVKKAFADLLKEASGGRDDWRVIMFVDDLDRITPPSAVEILECINNFLLCEHCVFVLAIDFDVVSKGVKAKYGDDMSKDKGKAFFDKIINIPFVLPVEEFDIRPLIEEHFLERGEAVPENIELYEKALTKSVGKNPRSIKKVMRRWRLSQCIDAVKGFNWESDPEAKLYAFATICKTSKWDDEPGEDDRAYAEFEKLYKDIDVNVDDTKKREINKSLELSKTTSSKILSRESLLACDGYRDIESTVRIIEDLVGDNYVAKVQDSGAPYIDVKNAGGKLCTVRFRASKGPHIELAPRAKKQISNEALEKLPGAPNFIDLKEHEIKTILEEIVG